jgi:hypothetical protein
MQAAADANGKAAELQKVQKQASEEQAKALAEVGLAADGTIASMGKLIESFINAGLIQLSENEALRGYQASLDSFNESVKQNGATLDITTEKGRNNSAALDGIAQAGLRVIDSMAKNGASQQDLQGKLRGTYNDLINAYGAFGITGAKADELARAALGVPKGVPIDVAIQNYADSMAKLNGVKQAADNLAGLVVPIHVQVTQSGSLSPQEYSAALSKARSGAPVYHESGGRIPEYHSIGGAVGAQYLAGGGRATTVAMIPNGTDTVPVMGTPGEFMVKRSSARSLGYEQLAYANATGRWPGTGSSGPQVSVTYGNVTVTDINELMRRQDTASRDALAMLRP